MVVDIVKSKGVQRIVNYLDDFIVVGNTYAECLESRNILTGVLETLGFEVAWKKVTEPDMSTTFLGININSETMSLTLPQDKLVKLKESILEIYNDCITDLLT